MKIFVLSCGTTACFNFVKKIKESEFSDVYLIGVDINKPELVATTNYLNEFYTVPPVTAEDYYEVVLDLLDKLKPDFIIPSFDADQHFFYNGNVDLKSRNIVSLGIPADTLEFYADKKSMNELMSKYGIPVPIAYAKKDKNIVSYFAKPIHGVASVGAMKISEDSFDKFHRDGYLIQEVCSGPEITVQCFKFKEYFRCICRERIQTKAGVCTKTRIFYDLELSNISKRFSECIKTPILFNLQFMKNRNNQWVITDVNLRMAGGGYLTQAVGWNEPLALISLLINGEMNSLNKYLPTVNGDTYVIATTSYEVTRSNYRN